MRTRSRSWRAPRRRAIALAAAVILVGAFAAWFGGPEPGAAASPFAAGQAATSRAPLGGTGATVAAARAARDGWALGLPAASKVSVDTVTDRFLGVTYTEVTATDPTTGPVAMTRYDTDGRLLGAVRFGWHASSGPGLGSPAAAEARAAALLRGVGLGRDGAAVVTPAADDGWIARWPRIVAGVPALGDGIAVTLFGDGALHAVARSERPLAAAPTAPLPEAQARRTAGDRLDGWFRAADRRQARIEGLALAWVAPNDAFDPAGPDAPAPVLRLAWVVTVRADGALSERFQAMEMYLDAGDGALLGGDLLR